MKPQELRKKISDLEDELSKLKITLVSMEFHCSHEWSDIEYIPEIIDSHFEKRDTGGFGSFADDDNKEEIWVEREEIPKWTRKCSVCEKVEITKQSREQTIKVPVF
jgi:hypothetical protein